MIGLTIDRIRGRATTRSSTRAATDGDIAGFVDAVGRLQPQCTRIRPYAAGTMFKARIAPGIWTAGLISAVIGTRLPGPGAIYLSAGPPVPPAGQAAATVITARVEVVEISRGKQPRAAPDGVRAISAARTC